MKRRTFPGLILQILPLIFATSGNAASNIPDVIGAINQERHTEMNIFVNLNPATNSSLQLQYSAALHQLNRIPKLVKTRPELTASWQKLFSAQVLTIGWISWESVNATVAFIDQLLWTLHFKDILLIYHDPAHQQQELLSIFHLCWKHGFTAVLVWCNRQLYTYHPYPAIVVKTVNNISEFSEKSHLDNFQRYNWIQPAVEFAPRFFSYRTRSGQLKRAGYLYSIIDLFLTHHNGCIDYYYLDMWANVTSDALLQLALVKGFTFVPLSTYYHQYLLPSNALYLARGVILVPSAREIAESLYLIISFDSVVWLLIVSSGFLFFLLISLISVRESMAFDWGDVGLQAFQIIIFLSVSTIRGKSLRNFILALLFLFTGLFLTNYYCTSLSSLYTSKVYEPQLRTHLDIERTDLKIFEYSGDLKDLKRLECLPPIIKQRRYVGNDTELRINRQRLNMTYIYGGLEDLIDYILFQQIYLDKPIAIKLDEPLQHRPFFVNMPHRSPLFEQFNRYLSLIRDSGLLTKFLRDAYWAGFLSGNLKFFLNPPANRPLPLSYFHYAFLMLMCGLASAFVCFVVEYIRGRLRSVTYAAEMF